ncbi:MAG: NAD(+) kinase [Trizodia sp. TS-e1964]|nr:MAG: NAD(+) kinase [Trizodia sp. TS-e1964]
MELTATPETPILPNTTFSRDFLENSKVVEEALSSNNYPPPSPALPPVTSREESVIGAATPVSFPGLSLASSNHGNPVDSAGSQGAASQVVEDTNCVSGNGIAQTFIVCPPPPQESDILSPTPKIFPLRPPPPPASTSSSSSTLQSRRPIALSINSVPRQTIMKALASARLPGSDCDSPTPMAESLAEILHTTRLGDGGSVGGRGEMQAAAHLSDALELQLNTSGGFQVSPLTTQFPALQSPCFFHQRFDEAVKIDKIFEEIDADDAMSHSRLMQTATGVREVSRQLQRRPIKRAVRSVMIVTKARDNTLVTLTRELAEWLLTTPRYGSDTGVVVYVDGKLRKSKRFGADSLIQQDARFANNLRYWTPELCWSSPEKFDLVLTLGGDGTVLYTSWLFQRVVPPILSFSLGSLGFLTNFPFTDYRAHLDSVMGEAGMRVNLRMRFTCTVYRAACSTTTTTTASSELQEAEQFEVLNELVIDRGPSPYVSNLELYGDNELLTVIQADGCIFSTPTGSTAYSLSAGGSLVHPSIPAILLTPICPHTLSFRPMVLADTMLLRISVPASSRATAYCSFDGKSRVELRQGDAVTLAASAFPFPTVLRAPTEWFDSISRTLRWNTRGAAQKAWDAGAGEEGEDAEWDIDTVPVALDSGLGSEEGGSSVGM